MLTPQNRVTRNTFGVQAYETLREAIITWKLKPGQMVYEAELADELGISRTPVREAFRMLLSEELIDVLPQKGARVELISKRKIAETNLIRESLETVGFRLLARDWKPEEAACRQAAQAAERLIEKQREASERKDAWTFLSADEAFHQTLLALTDNRTLLSVVFTMRGHLNRLRYLLLEQASEMDELIAEHEQLLAAVRSNDEALAERLLRRHLHKILEELPEVEAKFPHYFKP